MREKILKVLFVSILLLMIGVFSSFFALAQGTEPPETSVPNTEELPTNTEEPSQTPPEKNVTVTVLPAGKGSVTVNGENSPTGVYSFPVGTLVKLVAAPAEYHAFSAWSGWNGIGSDEGSEIQFEMPDENIVLQAEFIKTHFQVTVNGENKGIYQVGQSVSIEAQVSTGEEFVTWNEENSGIDLEEPLSLEQNFIMPAQDVNLKFETKKIIYYLTVQLRGPGLVEIAGKEKNADGKYEVVYGEVLQLTATSKGHAFFVMWSTTGGAVISNYIQTPTQLTCPAGDFSVTAQFATSMKPLTVTVSGAGTTTPDSVNVSYGVDTEIPLVATPNAGWEFDHWECTSQQGVFSDRNRAETTFCMPDEACTVTAVFRKGEYYIHLETSEGGSVEGNSGPYEMGTQVSLLAKPQNGFLFSHWESDAESLNLQGKGSELVLAVPGNSVTLRAVFIVDPNAIKGGGISLENFPWLSLSFVFLLAAVAIALIVIREKNDISYMETIRKWLKGKK